MEKKKKILIATGIFPPDIGGPATMLEALRQSLIEYNFEVKVITFFSTPEKDYSKINEKWLYRINRQNNPVFSYAKYFFKMWKLSHWADVLYVTDTYSVGYFAYLIKKFSGKRYMVRFAGDSAWEIALSRGWTDDYILDFLDKKYNSRIEKLKKRRKKILVEADKIIAVSQFIKTLAERIGVSENKIKVIYNAIDFMDKSFDPAKVNEIREKYNKDSKIIITACRLTPWKGVAGVIKILTLLKNKVGKINFLILGSGPESNNLKRLAADLGVIDNVHFLGKVEHNKILNYFKAADLFVLNSNYEGLSHTLLEVMIVETPIITTNIDANKEVIEDGKEGLLVNYNNQEELLKAALKILIEKQTADFLTAKAKEKSKDFNFNKTVKETVELLNEIFYE
ncbi:glycosyltransferase family 4 protein [Patescibacteria group bacterium]|nr:glycosyltransferase family 4 protein [Patescibacteria group bacterium]